MRLNRPSTPADHPKAARNFEGGFAYSVSPEMELYLLVCSSLFGEDTFYEPGDRRAQRLRELLDQVEPAFALRLAVYARQTMHLRTTPQVILAEVADRYPRPKDGGPSKPSLVRQLAPLIARRADEPAEDLAYWLKRHGSKSGLPNALKRGLADAMRRFDRYQLAKYDRDDMAVNLRDVLRITHPCPVDNEQSAAFRALLDGTIGPAETWEVAVSTQGNRAEVWDAIAPRMGVLALLRNLRHMEKAGAREALAVATAALRDPDRIRRSGILPFQFLAAWREVNRAGGSGEILSAIEAALQASIDSLPELPGRTVVIVDCSGSMDDPLSARSSMSVRDAASALAAMLWAKTGAPVMLFAAHTEWVDLQGLSPLAAAEAIARDSVGEATFGWLAMQRLVKERVQADRVIVLSDQQCYAQRIDRWGRQANPEETMAAWWRRYRQQVSPQAHLYDIHMAGYPTVQFAEDDPSVTLLAGWSERVLDLVQGVAARERVLADLQQARV